MGQRVVAGGAGRRPGPGEPLAGLEDLLHQHVGAAGERGEVVEVALRVAQPVGVVDPQPVDEALVEPAPDLDVRGVEDLRVLDAHAGEGVDREEAPVVQLGVGAPPGHQLVVLAGVHLVGVGCGGRARRARAVRQRVAVVVVAQLVALHRQVGDPAVGQQVVVAHHRDPDPAAAGLPVDVEGGGVRRAAAVPQQVPPPAALDRRRDPDVVGDDVDEHPHAEPPRLGRDRGEPLGATPGGVEPVVRDHVVAVVAAGLRGQDRRQVDPVDAQRVEVRQPPGRLVQVVVGGDLEPVGAGRSAHGADQS